MKMSDCYRFPPFPKDRMCITILEHSYHEDVRAYCTEKGCLACLRRNLDVIVKKAKEGSKIDFVDTEKQIEQIRKECWKKSDVCYPLEALVEIPRPVFCEINDDNPSIRSLINGEEGHTPDSTSVIVSFDEGKTPDEVIEIDTWMKAITALFWHQREEGLL